MEKFPQRGHNITAIKYTATTKQYDYRADYHAAELMCHIYFTYSFDAYYQANIFKKHFSGELKTKSYHHQLWTEEFT